MVFPFKVSPVKSLNFLVEFEKKNKMSCCFKTDPPPPHQSNNSCDSNSLLPFHPSPFPESNQPSSLGPCASCCLLVMFFPVLIFLFLFFWFMHVLEKSKVVMDIVFPCTTLPDQKQLVTKDKQRLLPIKTQRDLLQYDPCSD